MSRLSSAMRRKLPKADFGVPSKAPGSGSYPLNDENHARNALARVSQFGSPSEQSEVRSKVKRKFGSIKVGGK